VGGVDAWFHLLYAEALRRDRRLPARVPHFLLERCEQRYPPLFAALLALLPRGARLRARSVVTPLLDCAQLALLLLVARAHGLDPRAALLAGLVYATTPTLVLEHSTLNPRALGSLLLTSFMLYAETVLSGGGPAPLVVGALAGALLLLTLKLGAQVLFVLVVATSLAYRDAAVAGMGLLSTVLALLLSGGFYLEVLRAHAEILRFYFRHAADLNAHQVYDSPLYSERRPPGHRPERFYRPGLSGAWRLARGLLAHLPGVLLLPWLAWRPAPDAWSAFLLLWTIAVCAAAVLTTFVPPLRFLGEGFRYLKFAAFPLALLIGQALAAWPEALAALGLVAASGWLERRLLWARPFETLDADLAAAVAYLRGDPRQRIATLPSHLADPLACLAGKKVLWGGHSSGYGALEAWSPLIRRPISDLLDEYGVPLLLIDTRYVQPRDLGLEPAFRRAWERGRFVLLERRPAAA
jgi:hypothetical protein